MWARLGWSAVVVALLAAGCRGPALPAGSPETAAAGQTDIWFMQHVVPHLRQMVSIVSLTRDQITHPALLRLADQITERSQANLDQLQGWLSALGLAPHGHSHQRVERRRQTDLERLSQLRGTAFDLAFLEVVTARHRAGAAMTATEVRQGTHPEVRQLARRMLGDQQAEIRQMDAWKHAWSTAPSAISSPEARQRRPGLATLAPPGGCTVAARADPQPWPRSSAIEVCGRTRQLWESIAAEGGTMQLTSAAVPSRLTSRHRCPSCTTGPRATQLASTPGGCTPRHPRSCSSGRFGGRPAQPHPGPVGTGHGGARPSRFRGTASRSP
jgi:uncharacterized protein (DUF305 family)